MSENFLIAQKFTAKWEGGLDDDPYDAGGITKYGVSFAFLKDVENESQNNRAVLRGMGVQLPVTKEIIRALTRQQANELFNWQFWRRLGLDRFPMRVGVVLYDAAVNCGRKMSVKFGQRGCIRAGILSGKGGESDDGILGRNTEAVFKNADNTNLLDYIIDARDDYYYAIVKNKPSQKRFLKGWLNRTGDLRKYLRGL